MSTKGREKWEKFKAGYVVDSSYAEEPNTGNAGRDRWNALKKTIDIRSTAPRQTAQDDSSGAKKGFFDRLGLTVSGGAKGSLAGNMDAMGVAYEAGQSGRTRRDTAELKDAQWAVARAKHDYDADPSEVNKSALEIATTKMKAFADVLGEGAYEQALEAAYDAAAQFDTVDLKALYNSLGVVTPKTGTGVQQQAAKAARDLAARVQDSATEDILEAKDGTSKFWQMAIDAGASATQMALDAASNAVLGTNGSMVPFATRAFGGATMEARQGGADLGKQALYGAAQTAKEVFTEKMFNIALPYAKTYGKGGFDGIVENGIRKAADKLGKSKIGKAALEKVLTFGASAATEGMEELIGDWMEWQLPRIYGGDVATAEETLSDSLYDFVVGFMSGMIGGAMTEPMKAINSAAQAREAKNAYGAQQLDLVNESEELSPGNELAKKYRERLDGGKNLSGRQLIRLIQQNETDMLNGDKAKIQAATEKRLTELGESDNVRQLAEIVARQMAGEELSRDEQMQIDGSKYGKRVLNELNPSNIRSGGFASGWAKSIGTNTINHTEYNADLMSLAGDVAGVSTSSPVSASKESAPTAGSLTPAAVAPATERFTASESGKLTNKKTGADLGNVEITSSDGKSLKLKTESGEIVDAKDVDFRSKDEAMVYSAVLDMGVSPVVAQSIVDNFDGTDGRVYAADVNLAYQYGKMNFPKSYLDKLDIKPHQAEHAYNLGRSDAKAEAVAPKTKRTVKGKRGTVIFETAVDESTMTPIQKASLNGIKSIADLSGLNVHVFESRLTKDGYKFTLPDGTVTGANGWYVTGTNDIWIDMNAGNAGEGTMLYTAAHEISHFIKEWSPTKWRVLADFLLEQYGEDVPLDALLERQMAKVRKNNPDLQGNALMDAAYEELVSDAMSEMLVDGEVVQKLAELKQKDKTLWEKIKDAIRDLLEKWGLIRKEYEGRSVAGEAEFLRGMDEAFKKLQQLYTDAFAEASENFAAAADEVLQSGAKPVTTGEIVTDGAVVVDGKGNKYSIRSMKADIAEGKMFDDLMKYCGWSQARVNELRKQLTDLVAYMEPHRDILDMNETYGREGRKFSPYKPNSDPLYQISMDFSTLCSKRLLTQYVIENLQLRENRPMSAEEQMAIRDMLIEYRQVEKGLQVACAMCYVEAARLKSPKQMQRWLDDPAPLLRDYFGKANKAFNDSVKDAQADFKESRGYARNAPKKEMSAADVRELNKIGPRMRAQYQLSEEEMQIVERAKSLPNSTYLTAGNLASLSETDPVIYRAYTSFVRTATRSKSLETDEPYYYGDSTRDNGNGIIVSDSFIEAVNRENGMRFSSWSDWRIQHLLDYITAVIDNSVRGAAMHGYTKFAEEVRVLGKTGMMFNLSGVTGTQTGLNPDGSLNFSPTESIDINDAIELRKEFPETAGLQCIGVSDDHIFALLRSDIIDYVIPYHVSGLNAGLRRMADIYGWKDYTSTQHAVIDSSVKHNGQEHWHEEPVFSEFFVGYDTGMTGEEAMQESARRYVDMCRERGLTPKFEKFAKEPGYWKLLVDRKMINQKTGELIRQKPVTPTFDFDAIKAVVDRHVENYDSGLEARALSHIVKNWDSVPGRIRELKKRGTKKAKAQKALDILHNEMMAAQPKSVEVKRSERDAEATGQYADGVKFSERVTDKDTLKFLNGQKTITTYKTMQLVDGKLYPPMAARTEGKYEDYSILGQWEQATEHPELITDGNQYKLDKGKGQGSLKAAYNPYMHSSNLVLNDQFSGAYSRPQLVTVECEVPVSELTSGYHAQYAKDSVGWHAWHTGTVAGQLRKARGIERQVFLSRWIKPVRIVPDSEVAGMYKDLLDGTDIAVPDNVVTPSLLAELKKAGVKTKESGKVKMAERDDLTYAEITEKQRDLYQRKMNLAERKREANSDPELLQAMDAFYGLSDEMRELLQKRRQGTATQEDLDRIEEIKVLRDVKLQQVVEIQERLGLKAMEAEDAEIRKMNEDLRVAADAAWKREGAERESAAISKAGVSAPEYFRKKALKSFKTTTNFNEAGYLLPDGKLLNFSGGERNHRYRDHREIGEIYEATQGAAALNRFMSDGNIRIMAESPGVDITSGVEPTKEQYAAIRRFVNANGVKSGKFFVDFSDAEGHRAGNYFYEGRVSADRVINDIKHFYATGEIRAQSAVAQFRYSDRDFPDNAESVAKEHFGTTNKWAETGWLLQDGTQLDFSGRHWERDPDNEIDLGEGFYSGHRNVEHYEIAEAFPELRELSKMEYRGEHLDKFLKRGNIRVVGDGMLDIETMPTEAQIEKLRGYFRENIDKYIVIGIGAGGLEFREGTKPATIIEAIRDYFSNNRGSQSELMQFHTRFSDRDIDSVSNRDILANAFMDVAQNDVERGKIAEYQQKIKALDEDERKLRDIRAQLHDLSFSAGPRDNAKIRELREKATKLANRIGIQDKQLLRLEASKPLMSVLEREKKLAYSRASQKWEDRIETARTGRSKTEMRHKIKKIVGELNNLLLHGTKDKHIMIGLQKATAEALSAINMDTVAAEKRLAKIQAKIDKATDPAEKARLQQSYARVEAMGDNMSTRLTALKNAYEEIKDSGDPLVANAYQPEIEERIKNLRKMVGDTPLRNMSMEQLEFTYDTYKMVLTTIRNANKAFKNERGESIAVLGNRSMEEIGRVGGKKELVASAMRGPLGFAWSGMKPTYAFKAIGSDTLSELFSQVRAGEDVWATDVNDAKEFYSQKTKQYNYDSWDLEKEYTFTSKSGKEFKLTLEQIMSLYAYSKRKQADAHLEKGGFVFDSSIEVVKRSKLGIPVKYRVNTAHAHALSRDTLMEICKTLTDEQVKFVDEMQDYLSTVMGEKGNEVSLKMYGVKLFKEKFYFPLKSAKQFMYEQYEVAGDRKIKNSGFSKDTTPHASNPVILNNFTDVWATHVNDMAMYHAFVLPMEDFERVFNYKTPTSDTMPTESVKGYLQDAYGVHPEQYIKQLMTDLNGGARIDPTAGIINKGIALFKKSAVFSSLSVVIQQPSAIARAMAYIDAKYFVGKPGLKDWDEVKKYAPVAIIKEMGYFDTNMGKSTVEFIKSKEYTGVKSKMKALVTDRQYRDEILSKAPSVADELAWCQIWNAVKKEIAETKKLQGEELLQAAGKRFTEVIVNTQVYDSVLTRSGMMRSKDTGMKMATSFMAEPTTSLNMIADALIQGKRGNKGYARKAIGAVAASMILNSILVSFVYAGRDDDEDKTYIEKYAGSLTSELIDSFNPLTLIPFVKDIVSIAQGYDVERSDMAVITDLFNAWKKLSRDNLSVYRKVEGFGGAIASIFGLPLKNIMRDVRGIYNTVKSAVAGPDTTGRGVLDAARESLPKWMGGGERSNADQLYAAMLSGDTGRVERLKARFKNDGAFTYAVRYGLMNNDKRITAAAKARAAGNQTEYMRLAREIVNEGHFSQDDVVRAVNYVLNRLTKKES